MSRIHLFEFEDLPWFPRLLRDYMTGWLDFVNQANGGWDTFAPEIETLLRESESERLVDLGSGGGGPVVRIRRAIADTEADSETEAVTDSETETETENEANRIDPLVLLTDKYPNHDALLRAASDPSGKIDYRSDSIDATDVPADLEGVRTMFCSFHHFRPDVARRILADARDKGRAIGIFEGTARTVPALLATSIAPLVVLVTTPFIRPFRWGRLIFTYPIPILPLLCLWDGWVSCLRSYSAKELADLVSDLESDSYTWDVGERRFPTTPVKVAYLIGHPARS